jgi:hypothetical protein
MSFAFCAREWRRGVWTMLETHTMMSLLIFCLTFLLVLHLIFLKDLTIAHMVLVHESGLVPGCFGVDPLSHHGVCPPRRHGLPVRGVYSHFEPSRFDDPLFPHRGSCPTRSNGEVERIVTTSLGQMVKCWIPKIFLTNPSTEPSTFSHPM